MGRMVEVHSSEVGKPTTSHSPFFSSPIRHFARQDEACCMRNLNLNWLAHAGCCSTNNDDMPEDERKQWEEGMIIDYGAV